MTDTKWTVYWQEYSAAVYLYGSKITFHKIDDVEFENPLMPPGTVIKEWYSKTNYQQQRIEPTLPIIDGESRYRISINIDSAKNESCLVRLVFYDRYEIEAGNITLRDGTTDFKCPLKTYSYRIQLINGGVTKFHFHSIEIREVLDETSSEHKKTE